MKNDALFGNEALTHLLMHEMEKCDSEFVHPILIPEKGKAMVCILVNSDALRILPVIAPDKDSINAAQIAIIDHAIFCACQFIFRNAPRDVHDFLEKEMQKSIIAARAKFNLQAFASEEIHVNSLEEAEEVARVIRAKLDELRKKRG